MSILSVLEERLCRDVTGVVLSFLPLTQYYGLRSETDDTRMLTTADIQATQRRYWAHTGIFRSLSGGRTVEMVARAITQTDSVLLLEQLITLKGIDFVTDVLNLYPLIINNCIRVLDFIFAHPQLIFESNNETPWGIVYWKINGKPVGHYRTLRLREAWTAAVASDNLQIVKHLTSFSKPYNIATALLVVHCKSKPMLDYVCSAENQEKKEPLYISAAFIDRVLREVPRNGITWEVAVASVKFLMKQMDDRERVELMWNWGFRGGARWDEPRGPARQATRGHEGADFTVPQHISEVLAAEAAEQYSAHMKAIGAY
jgi:hypothetical protein